MTHRNRRKCSCRGTIVNLSTSLLGNHAPPLTPYLGKSYTWTGRYICLGNPEPGQTTTSRFGVAKAYREFFGSEGIPAVSGITVEVDTEKRLPDGRSSSFIHQISLKGAEQS